MNIVSRWFLKPILFLGDLLLQLADVNNADLCGIVSQTSGC